MQKIRFLGLNGVRVSRFGGQTPTYKCRICTDPGNPEKPWKIFEVLEIPGIFFY